jgi:hypothetical protein
MPSTSQKVLTSTKKLVPVAVKRPLRKALSARYLRYVDPDWHRRVIGNVPHWEYMGKLQLDYLVERGLKPEHNLLDVGCGPLRAGIHFIEYLTPATTRASTSRPTCSRPRASSSCRSAGSSRSSRTSSPTISSSSGSSG